MHGTLVDRKRKKGCELLLSAEKPVTFRLRSSLTGSWAWNQNPKSFVVVRCKRACMYVCVSSMSRRTNERGKGQALIPILTQFVGMLFSWTAVTLPAVTIKILASSTI